MRLRPCFYCKEKIPRSIEVCPYCHHNEKGEDERELQNKELVASSRKKYDADIRSLGSDDSFVRQEALERLCQKESHATEALITALAGKNQQGLGLVAKALGRLHPPKALRVLSDALKTSDEDLRAQVVWALTQYRDAETVPDLISEMQRPNTTVQSYLAYSLGGYQDARIVKVLKKLVSHPNPEVAFHAIDALGGTGDATAIAVLRQALRRKDPLIHLAAEAALRRLGGSTRMPFWSSWWRWGVAVLLVAAVGIWIYR